MMDYRRSKAPGFHDEPLKGKRSGPRSIRLSKSYRAIYRIEKDTKDEEFVHVEEVTKHEY
jgi:proteic killer suppression protein